VTVKVLPAIVSVPVRDPSCLFLSTEYETLPSPWPVAPPLTEIQSALLDAVQLQLSAEAETVTESLPPSALRRWLVGEIVNEHTGGGGAVSPVWLTVKLCPAMINPPVRAAPPFAETLNVTVPLPCPGELP
jgi:hypothetical protein